MINVCVASTTQLFRPWAITLIPRKGNRWLSRELFLSAFNLYRMRLRWWHFCCRCDNIVSWGLILISTLPIADCHFNWWTWYNHECVVSQSCSCHWRTNSSTRVLLATSSTHRGNTISTVQRTFSSNCYHSEDNDTEIWGEPRHIPESCSYMLMHESYCISRNCQLSKRSVSQELSFSGTSSIRSKFSTALSSDLTVIFYAWCSCLAQTILALRSVTRSCNAKIFDCFECSGVSEQCSEVLNWCLLWHHQRNCPVAKLFWLTNIVSGILVLVLRTGHWTTKIQQHWKFL